MGGVVLKEIAKRLLRGGGKGKPRPRPRERRKIRRAISRARSFFGASAVAAALALFRMLNTPRLRQLLRHALRGARRRFGQGTLARIFCNKLLGFLTPRRSVGNLLTRSRFLGYNKKTRVAQYRRRGGFNEAYRDFDALTRGLKQTALKGRRRGGFTSKLPDGRIITIYRSKSGRGRPTLSIRYPADKVTIKIRYR